MKEFLKRLGIITCGVALIAGFFILTGFWLLSIDSGNTVAVFITRWFVVLPLCILIIYGSIKVLSDILKWLFIEPFRKSK